MSHNYVNNDPVSYEVIELQRKNIPEVKTNQSEIVTSPPEKPPNNQKLLHVIIILLCVVGILTALGLTFGIFNLYKQPRPQTFEHTNFNATEPVAIKSPLGTFPNPARSCVELRDAGLQDGIYVIRSLHKSLEAYCDMKAAGGGWILAATINNNSFNYVQSYSDLWFVTTSSNNSAVLEYQNWMNTNTYGTFDTCTKMDYKSQAYFEYHGQDIMLRHVPNRTPLEASREMSTLQYQSVNGFMQHYGGNLHKIYNYHYPLQQGNEFYPDVKSMLDRLEKKSTEFTNLISDYYFYDYGTHAYQLYDKELFGQGYGMRVAFSAGEVYDPHCSYCPFCPRNYKPRCPNNYVQYGWNHRCDQNNIIQSSRKMHPFFALFAVGDFDNSLEHVSFGPYGFRPKTDSVFWYKGNHTFNNFILHYEAPCRNRSTTASFCDIMFYVINTETWKSSGNQRVELKKNTFSNTYYFGLRAYKPLSNILLGYTMITRKTGDSILATEVNAFTYKILEVISESDFCPDCSYADDVLSVPVEFSIGNDSVVNSMLPPSVKPLPTGFVQFRAYGKHGSVYAMCPAVKVNDWRSEFVCIGGMNNPDFSNCEDCNDFTNWNGLPETTLNKTTPVEYAHSQRDLDSTIMIFYR